ncbi:L,D-transpeptidase family protein [Massilia cavernae]|uniref:Murein L,D-transpeptidase n=1 Tax=Massilia cavernae TaxID=2320864 RepID=A0A418Y849_9BURK|nr:L,D-transpeptidase family protein [Massilia cavernae]RJG27465.1 murein L,D-transpeptidase [Massilia cavernae]
MKHRTFLRPLALAAALALAAVPAGGGAQVQIQPLPAQAQIPVLAERAQIQLLAAQAPREVPGHVRQYDEREWMRRFYAPRAWAPAWNAAQAREAVALIGAAGAHGLSPNYYGHAVLQRRVAQAGQPDAALDVALTRAFLHYLADLRIGRVRPDYHTAAPDTRLKQFDPVRILSAALAGNGQLAAAVVSAEPAIVFYPRVKDMLAHYRGLAQTPHADLPAVKTLRPGSPYPGAAALRGRLVLLGDLPADERPAQEPVYSAELAEGVRQFQARHGLAEDGVIGRETSAALNVPLERRVRQLELALERLRWIPELRPGPVIAVNLPAFRLWAFQHGAGASGEEALEMRVIVGEALKTPTPLFIGSMRHLEFNPYWNVPRSIAVEELIPKMLQDPGYLANNDMEMVSTAGGGATSAVNGGTLGALRAGKLRIRQRPGPKNALGAVKFAMPNPMNIYLHSTAAQELFDRNRRDLSHGCIRVEKPLELARFVLADQPEWTDGSVELAMLPGPTRKVDLGGPLPVILFYATAMVDREGRALFPRDVYLRDAKLEQALRVDAE